MKTKYFHFDIRNGQLRRMHPSLLVVMDSLIMYYRFRFPKQKWISNTCSLTEPIRSFLLE